MITGVLYINMSEQMTPEKEFAELFDKMYKLCFDNGWGDPFNYSRAREIHMANYLQHKISTTLSGADAIDEDGEAEYKSTISKDIKATYNGISKQENWDKQVEYLKNDKIGKYKNHYFSRYENGAIVEMYKMSCDKVLEEAERQLKKKFQKENLKDPRLGFNINKTYIKNNSERLL